MKPTRLLLLSLALVSLSAACTATPEYPGFKTNVHIGNVRTQTNIGTTSPAKASGPENLVHTQDAVSGGQAVCIGAWCSCQTE